MKIEVELTSLSNNSQLKVWISSSSFVSFK